MDRKTLPRAALLSCLLLLTPSVPRPGAQEVGALLTLPFSAPGQSPRPGGAEEMGKLYFLIGEWKGKGSEVHWDGSRGDEFSQKTTVRAEEGGSVLRIKDGKNYDTPGASHTSTLDASVYYDAGAKTYRWRGENAYGREYPLEAKLVDARTFQYGVPYTVEARLPNGARRTTIEVTEGGEWHETLEVWKIDRWYKVEEAFLRRVK
jgi:hypothetical protein